jgi:hypothetical protein
LQSDNIRLPRYQFWKRQKLKNTVTDYDSAEQNFINIVSFFTHQRGLVLGVKVMENKKTSEITTVRELLEILNLRGFVFTLDPKKQSKTL